MYMIIFVLDDADRWSMCSKPGSKLESADAAVLESTGFHRLQREQCAHALSYRSQVHWTEEGHLTLFVIVETEQQVQACLQATEQTWRPGRAEHRRVRRLAAGGGRGVRQPGRGGIAWSGSLSDHRRADRLRGHSTRQIRRHYRRAHAPGRAVHRGAAAGRGHLAAGGADLAQRRCHGAPNLAAGNLLGSNAFNMFLLAVLDFVYRRERILRKAALKHALSGSLATFMIGLVVFFMLAGLAVQVGWVGLDSLLIMPCISGRCA